MIYTYLHTLSLHDALPICPGDPPDRTGAGPWIIAALVGGQYAEVDDVERRPGGIEADRHRPLQAAVVAPGSRALQLAAIDGEIMDHARGDINLHHLEADRRQCLADAGHHVPELRDEGLADIADGGIAREIKAVGGGMDAAGGDRLGRLARLAGEEQTHRRPRVGLAPILLVEQMAGIEIGPAVPAARSEEHTSELQSLMRISYAVFCLQKKQTKTNESGE